jgi:murein DD-endopeptidase MepM/ murein hydrolase activator NlpD
MKIVSHALVFALLGGVAAFGQHFTFEPPGALAPGSGRGRADTRNYSPGMRFPLEATPAYANSQVWGRGGMNGGGGSQCEGVNYAYPWRDNYCETRSWNISLCPAGQGHQGQDIRPASCRRDLHWAVAASDGTIEAIGRYSLYLRTPDGNTRYEYLHMSQVAVRVGDRVTRGARLGKVSNVFQVGVPTTIHLHFNLRQNVPGLGWTYVPPYGALIDAYQRLLAGQP